MSLNETATEERTNLQASQQKQANELAVNAPGKIRVIKRNAKIVSFEVDKIKVAITKAFLAIESGNAAASDRIHEKVNRIADDI
ncbi:MAG: hypothetical protein EVB00_01475, partial [SAR86 cluster bacterium]